MSLVFSSIIYIHLIYLLERNMLSKFKQLKEDMEKWVDNY